MGFYATTSAYLAKQYVTFLCIKDLFEGKDIRIFSVLVFTSLNFQVDWPQLLKKVANAIHWINLYPLDTVIGFPKTYPQEGDLSCG